MQVVKKIEIGEKTPPRRDNDWNRMGSRPKAEDNCECLTCGKKFHLTPSKIAKGKGRYCSRACHADAQRKITGDARWNWKGGPENWDRTGSGEMKKCAGCQVTFYAARKRIRYCSIACHHKATAKRGPEHRLWKGGTKTRPEEWKRVENQEWREAVFKRDAYICQMCHQTGGKLNAHHIKSWKDYPELRYVIDNGLTLCSSCHKEVHSPKKSASCVA